MNPETVERLAEEAARAWEMNKLREYFAILDRNRGRVNRAIDSGKITFEAADSAWRIGYAKGGAL